MGSILPSGRRRGVSQGALSAAPPDASAQPVGQHHVARGGVPEAADPLQPGHTLRRTQDFRADRRLGSHSKGTGLH